MAWKQVQTLPKPHVDSPLRRSNGTLKMLVAFQKVRESKGPVYFSCIISHDLLEVVTLGTTPEGCPDP